MAYSAAKATLTNYSKALWKQVAPDGVRVNTVAPGFIEAEGAKGLIEKTASKPGLGTTTLFGPSEASERRTDARVSNPRHGESKRAWEPTLSSYTF